MDPEAYRIKLEQDILDVIIEKLKNGQMDAKRAKDIARMILDKLHPPLSLEQIYEIAPTLDDHFTELTKAVLPVLKEHDEKVSKLVSEHAHKLINSGKLKEAFEAVKKATGRK